MTNIAIFYGVEDIRAEIPDKYLSVPGIIAVGAVDYRADRECDRCADSWRDHGWLVYASTGTSLSVLDCSKTPRAGSQR